MTKISKAKVTMPWNRICLSVLTVVAIACSVLVPLSTGPVMAQSDNPKPVAVIDGTFNVYVGKDVYLDATFSRDPGGNALTYKWTLESSPEGSTAVIGGDSAQTSFEADVAGTYRVKLVVNNGFVDSDPAYATIRVTKQPYVW